LISCPLRQGSGSWGINRTARKDTALLLADALGQTEPVRAVFVAAVRGRVPAAEVLTAMPGQARAASPTAAGGVHGFPPVLTSFVVAIPWKCGHFSLVDSCNFASSSDYRTPAHFVALAFAGAGAR